MIVCIRIPHQSPASFDLYRNEKEVLAAAIDYAIDTGREEPEDYSEAKYTLADDLNGAIWIESAEEVNDIRTYSGHQEHKVRAMADEIAEHFS